MDYRTFACLLLSILVGWTASHFRMPLAWVLGPLVTTAIFAMADVKVFAPIAGRRAGQLIIGASVGLNLTASVLIDLVGWLPVMIVTAVVAIVVAAAFSVGFARVTKLDQPTAFFAMMPGGMSEMANLGLAQGARPEPIALSQALRVAIVVCLLPPLLILTGDAVDLNAWTGKPPVSLEALPFIFLAGGLGALAFRLIGFQNPWMVGSLLGVAVLAVMGIVSGRLPVILVNMGQFFLGIAIGARFKGDIVRHLARLSVISIIFTIALTLVMAVYSEAIAAISGVGFANMMLSTAPGGFAEMVITAQVLHLQVTTVTAFHIVRSIIINGMALQIRTVLVRMRFFEHIDNGLRRLCGP